MKKLVFFLILMMMILNVNAQEKPLKRYSKKQLIRMLNAERLKTDSLQTVLSHEKNLNQGLEAENRQIQKLKEGLELDLKEQLVLKLELEKQYEDLNLQYIKLSEAPPKEVEVLDLYSFGYQPLYYSEREFNKQLDIAREEVQEFRMNNVLDLVRLLQSHKVEDEMKKVMFQAFKRTYKGYFDAMTQAQLMFYNPQIEITLKRGIRQKTRKEFDLIVKENRWIQLLESY